MNYFEKRIIEHKKRLKTIDKNTNEKEYYKLLYLIAEDNNSLWRTDKTNTYQFDDREFLYKEIVESLEQIEYLNNKIEHNIKELERN